MTIKFGTWLICQMAFETLNASGSLRNMISKDILATNIYCLGFPSNAGIANLDYTHKIVEVKEKDGD